MVLILMVSKILKSIIQTITGHILVLSLCTAKRSMLNDGWILWPCRPSVMDDPGSTHVPFFQFLPDLPPFLCACQQQSVLTTWIMLLISFFPSVADSSSSWLFPRFYMHLFCICCVSIFMFGLKSDPWDFCEESRKETCIAFVGGGVLAS